MLGRFRLAMPDSNVIAEISAEFSPTAWAVNVFAATIQ